MLFFVENNTITIDGSGFDAYGQLERQLEYKCEYSW
jgi:hypothetical protein